MLTKLSMLRLLTIFLICAVVAMWLATACTDDSGEVDPEVEEKGMTDESINEANEPSVVTPETAKNSSTTQSITEPNDINEATPETEENDMTTEKINKPSIPSPVSPEAAEKDMTTENLNEPNTPSQIPPEIVENEANDPCDIDPVLTGRKGMITRNSSEDVVLAQAIRYKYDDLFWRQPNVHAVGIGDITDENGEYTDIWGFRIHVTEKVDQNTLPPEDRIPDCLEGVPVQIIEEPMAELL